MCIESHCMLKNNHLYIMNVVFEFLGLGFLDLIYHCSINSKIHSFKNKMKLTKILAPKERNFVYALEEDGRVFLYIRHRIQQKCVRIRCRKKKCLRALKLHPINNVRYKRERSENKKNIKTHTIIFIFEFGGVISRFQ